MDAILFFSFLGAMFFAIVVSILIRYKPWKNPFKKVGTYDFVKSSLTPDDALYQMELITQSIKRAWSYANDKADYAINILPNDRDIKTRYSGNGYFPDGRRIRASLHYVRKMPWSEKQWIVVTHEEKWPTSVIHEVITHLMSIRMGTGFNEDHSNEELKKIESLAKQHYKELRTLADDLQ